MDWLMRFAKYTKLISRLASFLKIGLVSALILSSPRLSADTRSFDKYCNNKFYLYDGTPICSTYKLFLFEISYLNKSVEYVRKKYPSFVKRYGYKKVSVDREPLRVYVIPYSVLNDREAFPIDLGDEKVLGLYYRETNELFVTELGVSPGNTDFIHEFVHHLNDINNISSRDIDEEIAKDFEENFVE